MSFLSAEQQHELNELVLKICYRQADHIISAYDKNKDGKITVDELTAVFGEEKGKKNFEQTDTNKDGIVDREEVFQSLVKLVVPKSINVMDEKFDSYCHMT